MEDLQAHTGNTAWTVTLISLSPRWVGWAQVLTDNSSQTNNLREVGLQYIPGPCLPSCHMNNHLRVHWGVWKASRSAWTAGKQLQ